MATYKELEKVVLKFIHTCKSDVKYNIEDCAMDIGISAALNNYNIHNVCVVLRDVLKKEGYSSNYINELVNTAVEYYNK